MAESVRQLKKERTRRAIQEAALRLFLEHGYDATTVEQIAAEVGVSHMTFFRHFPTKESVVNDERYAPRFAELIAARPADESPLEAVHQATLLGIREFYEAEPVLTLELNRLLMRTPGLRTRLPADQAAIGQAFVAALASRIGGEVTLELRVAASAALAALTTAIAAWVEGDGAADLPTVVDQAFTALRGLDTR